MQAELLRNLFRSIGVSSFMYSLNSIKNLYHAFSNGCESEKNTCCRGISTQSILMCRFSLLSSSLVPSIATFLKFTPHGHSIITTVVVLKRARALPAEAAFVYDQLFLRKLRRSECLCIIVARVLFQLRQIVVHLKSAPLGYLHRLYRKIVARVRAVENVALINALHSLRPVGYESFASAFRRQPLHVLFKLFKSYLVFR